MVVPQYVHHPGKRHGGIRQHGNQVFIRVVYPAAEHTEDSPLIPIICDEFPKCANSGDEGFVVEARKHLGFLVAMTQSVHALAEPHGREGGSPHQESIDKFSYDHLAYMPVTLETASLASGLLGQRREPIHQPIDK